jgi:hypothetical protein
MTGLPTLDMALVKEIKRLLDNIKNDVDAHDSADGITDLVEEHKLDRNEAYRPLLKSFSDLLREKGYPQTADFLVKQWHLSQK